VAGFSSHFFIARNGCALRRQNKPVFMQQCLKTPRRTTRARIVSPEFLEQFFVAMHHAQTAFDFCF
jgi:hypothetical protein